MKKITKILSVLLALVLVFSSASFAFAKEKVTPVILVHGVGGTTIYENVGTEDEKAIINNGLGEIKDILLGDNMLAAAVRLLSSEGKFDGKKIVNTLGSYVKDNPFNCDKDGIPRPGQGIKTYWEDSMAKHKDYYANAEMNEAAIVRQMVKIAGAKNVYTFNYDWRYDACHTAEHLRSMIKKVKKSTGAKKVALVGCSFGGAVLSAYLDKYKKENDVERYVFVNPAIGGVDVARMYAMDFKIDKKTVLEYLDGMASANPGTDMETIMKAVKVLGDKRVEAAADNLHKYIKKRKNLEDMCLKVIKPWLGNVAALWECVPYDAFDKAVKEMKSIGFFEENGKLLKKIKHYHKVQGNFKKNVKYAKKHGAEVAIIANYGMPGIPVTSKAKNHTDGLIDTVYASGGATVAKYGKKLKGKNAKGKYVSPDKTINAKTCVLPNSTWFIKNVQHMQFRYGTKATKFVANLACGKVKFTLKAVKKKYKYSQFMLADENQKLTNIKK